MVTGMSTSVITVVMAGSIFQQRDRLVGIGSFENLEAHVLQHRRQIHPDERLVFDNKYRGCGGIHRGSI